MPKICGQMGAYGFVLPQRKLAPLAETLKLELEQPRKHFDVDFTLSQQGEAYVTNPLVIRHENGYSFTWNRERTDDWALNTKVRDCTPDNCETAHKCFGNSEKKPKRQEW